MLTKGFKDEERRKIDQILNAGFELEFVPELWKKKERAKLDKLFDQLLKTDIDTIERLTAQELIAKLNTQNFGFSNKESFADLLVKMSSVEPEYRSSLAKKAVAIYEQAQAESKTFSFGLRQKISNAQSLIKD